MAPTGMFDLVGRRALVIGGSSGIGLESASALCEAGADVMIAARDREKLALAADRLGIAADEATFAIDVRDVAALRRLAAALANSGRLPDVLVNSQGITIIKPALDLTEEEYDAIVDTNTKSVFFACQAFGEPMIGRGRGSVINIASLAAHTGWAQAGAYAISKHGVVALTASLAAEWGAHGVRVNAISPGFFLTDLNREKMSEERKAQAISRTAMHRMGNTAELRGAIAYLASDAAGFVTGTTLRVDGGYLASGI